MFQVILYENLNLQHCTKVLLPWLLKRTLIALLLQTMKKLAKME